MSKREFRKNEEIRVAELFLIDERGVKRGVMPTRAAIQIALDAGLDLVEVSPQAQPPVAKIVDFGKLQYEKEKQDRKARSQSKHGGELKGIRLTPNIGEHDMLVRVAAGQKFLDKGHRLKVEMRLRGRQKAHPEIGREIIARYISLLERDVVIEQNIHYQQSQFSAVINMKKK